MQSEEDIKERLKNCNEAMLFLKDKKEDNQDSIDLIAQEILTLEWALAGPKRHSITEIKRELDNFSCNGVVRYNTMQIIAYLARKLER